MLWRAATIPRPRSYGRLRVGDAILDGEIICADETGRPIFLEMLRGRHPVCFIAFDLLWLNGNDLRPLPLVERKKRLKRLLARRSNHLIAEAISVEGRGKALMAAIEEHDLEGIVAKRKSDPYRRGWKIKNDDGRGELLNGDMRTLARLRKGRPNLRDSIQPATSKNPNSTSRAATRHLRRRSNDSGVAHSTPDP